MLSWWPGEGTGEDIVGGHTGILGGATTFSPGMVGQAFNFSGAGDVVDTKDLKIFYDDGVTFDLWFKTTDTAGMLIADGGGASASNGMGLFIEPVDVDGRKRGQLQVFGSEAKSRWNFRIVGPLVDDDKFHHVAVTWTGQPGPEAVKLYFDGARYGLAATAEESIGTGLVQISIGWHSTITGYNQFQGLIDEVEVFNRPLSDDEIKTIFDAGSAGKCRAQCTPAPQGMVSWWPAEGSGEDIVGGHQGKLVGKPNFAPGMVGQAFSLDGVDDVIAPEDLKLFYDEGVTFDAWIKTTDTGALLIADGGGASVSNGMGLFIEPVKLNDGTVKGQLALFGSKQSSEWNFNLTGPLVDDDKFHHVAATWTGDNTIDGVRLYLDGVEVSRNTAKQSIGTGLVQINIGGHIVITGYRQFQGLIDEIEVFNRALSAQEIKNIFNAGSAGKCNNRRAG